MRVAAILRCCLGLGLMVIGHAVADGWLRAEPVLTVDAAAEQIEGMRNGRVFQPKPPDGKDAVSMAFSQPEASLEVVLQAYAQLTGKKVILGFNGPCDPAVFNLAGQGALTNEEKTVLIERKFLLEDMGFIQAGQDTLKLITSQTGGERLPYPCPKVVHSLNDLPAIDSPGRLMGIIIPLQHLTPKEATDIACIVKLAPSDYITEHNEGELECVSHSCRTLRTVYQLVHYLDAPKGTFVHVSVELQRQSCEDVLKEAMAALPNSGQPPSVSGLEGTGKWRLIARRRTNDVLILGPSSGFEHIKDLLEKLDHS